MPLPDRVDDFVVRHLPAEPQRIRDKKVIHDSVWGSNIFYPHEIALLDTPLLQRLRQLSQTGLAFYTYPSATHSRFEHTLGVTVMATRFAEGLNHKSPDRPLVAGTPERGELAEIRIAAILHDVGHALFSHASEEVYKWNPEIREMIRRPEFATANSQEVLSYLIVSSESFKRWFRTNIEDRYAFRVDLHTVAAMIIGRHPDRKKTYLAEIINGPFDADKLDYLGRDGHFCGLQLPSDIDRLFYTANVWEFDGSIRLVVESAVPVEQILFSKMMLYASIYHHHKVRAAECQLRAIIEVMSTENITVNGKPCRDPVDLLEMTDADIINSAPGSDNPILKKLLEDLSNRRLLKRAAVISKQTVDNFESCSAWMLVKMTDRHPSEMLGLRSRILDRLPPDKRCSIHELWLDFPELPTINEAARTQVVLGGEVFKATDLFPLQGWLKAYGIYRWRAHVFCPPDIQREVFEATRDELASHDPPIDLNELAWRLAHVPEEPT